MLPLSTQCEWIYFPNLAQFKELLPSLQLKPKKGVITINTPLINSSLQQLKYLDVYTKRLMFSYMIVPMPFGASKDLKALPFWTWLLFSSKNFNYIVKNVSILHLKSGNSGKPSYFPTSTPSRYTPHHHG
jgi:hypothetical protein